MEVAQGLMAVDKFALFFKAVFLFAAAITVLMSVRYLAVEGASPVGSEDAASASQSANALGVETPMSGVAITQGVAGRSGSGYTSSPRPTPKTVPPTRKRGMSDPTAAAKRNRSDPESCFFNAISRASSADTALPEILEAPTPKWLRRLEVLS